MHFLNSVCTLYLVWKHEIYCLPHFHQALQYLRKVCNHPALVMSPDHPLFSNVQDYLKKTGTGLRDIRHATKLQALK